MFFAFITTLYKLFIKLGRDFSYILFPPKCLNCSEMITDDESLCAKCWGKSNPVIGFEVEGARDSLADATMPWLYNNSPSYSLSFNRSHHHAHHYSNIYCYTLYDDVAKRIINKFKNQRRYECGNYMARMLGHRFARQILSYDIICPVPIHIKKLRKRYFNQADYLGALLAKRYRVVYDNRSLWRIRMAFEQKGLSRRQRQVNLRNAFVVRRPQVFLGRSVLLIDDVLTTGSTADECAKTLLAAGAKKVSVMAFARA